MVLKSEDVSPFQTSPIAIFKFSVNILCVYKEPAKFPHWQLFICKALLMSLSHHQDESRSKRIII